MFCKQCGKPIDDGQILCEDCKVNFGMGNNQNSNNAQPNNNMYQNYSNPNYNNQGFNNNANYNNGQNFNGNPNYNPNYNNYNPYSQPKSKLAAGLLGIFLGGLGVHNFYLGYTGKAIAQLLISLLTCGLGAIVSSIWGLIEGILILTGSINVDGSGRPLKD